MRIINVSRRPIAVMADDSLEAMMSRALGDGEKENMYMPSVLDQREYILQHHDKCSRDELIQVYRAVVLDGHAQLFRKQGKDTTLALNLQKVPDETIRTMYGVMSSIIAVKKSLAGI